MELHIQFLSSFRGSRVLHVQAFPNRSGARSPLDRCEMLEQNAAHLFDRLRLALATMSAPDDQFRFNALDMPFLNSTS